MPIGAIVGAVGAVGSAAISSSAVSSASNAATNAANQNNALQSQIYSQNSANEQPYIQAGDTANTALQGFLGLGGDAKASQTALDNYLNSTGYQFNLNQGLNAVQQSKAVSGLLNSGSTLQALDQYGTNLANQYGQQYVGNLQNVVNTGTGAANALSGAGQNYANAVSANNNNAANTSANAALTGASIDNSLINNALSAFGTSRGQSSFGSGSALGAANAFSAGIGG